MSRRGRDQTLARSGEHVDGGDAAPPRGELPQLWHRGLFEHVVNRFNVAASHSSLPVGCPSARTLGDPLAGRPSQQGLPPRLDWTDRRQGSRYMTATVSTQPTYQVVNPATGAAGESFDFATDAEVEAILADSAAAYRSWQARPITER